MSERLLEFPPLNPVKVQERLEQKNVQQKKFYYRCARPLDVLKRGDVVRISNLEGSC